MPPSSKVLDNAMVRSKQSVTQRPAAIPMPSRLASSLSQIVDCPNTDSENQVACIIIRGRKADGAGRQKKSIGSVFLAAAIGDDLCPSHVPWYQGAGNSRDVCIVFPRERDAAWGCCMLLVPQSLIRSQISRREMACTGNDTARTAKNGTSRK